MQELPRTPMPGVRMLEHGLPRIRIEGSKRLRIVSEA
jgi:hypothetical protein